MFAVIETGGKQYKVAKDAVISVEKLDADVGDQLELDKILLISKDGQVTAGTPYVSDTMVKVTILAQDRAKKIRVFKMKRRKRYRRSMGHRQYFTKVRIDDIIFSG